MSRLILAASIVAACSLISVHVSAGVGPNLLQNPGFTSGESSWTFGGSPRMSAVTNCGHLDVSSIHYHGDIGTTTRSLCAQGVTGKEGAYYKYSAWVKTQNVAGKVGVWVEWYGASGYLGGSYYEDTTLPSTGDWRKVEFVTPRTAPGTNYVGILLASDYGTSGDIWFDDIELRETTGPVQFTFTEPVQHGTNIRTGQPAPDIRLKLSLDPSAGYPASQLKAVAELLEHEAVTPTETVESTSWTNNVMNLSIPTERLAQGVNRLRVSIINVATNTIVMRDEWEINKTEWLSLDVLLPNSLGILGFTPQQTKGYLCRVTTKTPPGNPQETYDLVLSLLPRGGGTPVSPIAERSIKSGTSILLRFMMDGTEPGTYDLEAAIYKPGEEQALATATRMVSRVDPSARPSNATQVLPNGLMMVDGKLTFPIGIYMISGMVTVFPADQPWNYSWDHKNPRYYQMALDMIKNSPINCVIDYSLTAGGLEETRTFLDACHSRGIKVVYNICYGGPGYYLWSTLMPQLPQWPTQESFIRGCLQTFREHPAVFAIYLNDEGFGPEVLPLFKRNWQWAREEDPWHPAFSVHYNYFNSPEYAKATDTYGTDPYTLMGDIRAAVTSWRTARSGMSPEQPMWAVVQTFGHGYETCNPSDTREPTYDEMRCGSFCAVAEGATGIIYYDLHSMQRSPVFYQRWQELCSIAGEIQGLTSIIAMPTATNLVNVVSGEVSFRVKRSDHKIYVIAANPLRSEQTVKFRWPSNVTRVYDQKTDESFALRSYVTDVPMPALGARVLVGETP